MLEANYLTMLLKPNYEKAIDTAQDVLDTGLTVIYAPGTESMVEVLKNSPAKITRELAERTIVSKVIFFILSFIFSFLSILNFPDRMTMNIPS